MKIFNIIFCILFILFTALQYNDPDPYVWKPVYLYVTGICWPAFRGKYYPLACLAGVAVYAGYAVYLFFARDGVEDWITVHHAEDIAGTMKASTP